MTSKYSSVYFGDLCEHSAFGPRFSSDEYASDGNVACLRTMDMDFNGRINFNAMPLANLNLTKLKNHILRRDDLIITRTGAYLGKAAVFTQFRLPVVAGAFSICFRLKKNVASPKFIRYYLNSTEGQNATRSIATGSAQPNLNIPLLHSLQVPLPALHLQRKIAGVLSAYDDLIENNSRRIAILEEMAQAIYREWFVNFRFPGHENIKLNDSPLGMIPEGWKVERLADLCSLTMGQSPSSEFYNENGDGLPFHQGVTNFGERYPTHVTYTTVTNRLAAIGDVLFSVRAPVGRLNIADTQLVVGRGVSAIQHKQGKQVFLFHQLREKFKEEDTMGGGTIFKSVTKEDMQKIELISPSTQLINNFEETVGGHFSLYHNLTERNRLLRQTRDLLLPKLISGQLNVEELDIDAHKPMVEVEVE
jgi:type I restriction enzyme S subunit